MVGSPPAAKTAASVATVAGDGSSGDEPGGGGGLALKPAWALRRPLPPPHGGRSGSCDTGGGVRLAAKLSLTAPRLSADACGGPAISLPGGCSDGASQIN